ncbi:MAG: hypothetical protein WBY47_09640, partial [Desulfobacterales bacterium]
CETLEKRPFLPNPPKADKFLRLPREMRSLFLWGHAQISILKILNVFLWLKFSTSLNLNDNDHFSKVSLFYIPIDSIYFLEKNGGGLFRPPLLL